MRSEDSYSFRLLARNMPAGCGEGGDRGEGVASAAIGARSSSATENVLPSSSGSEIFQKASACAARVTAQLQRQRGSHLLRKPDEAIQILQHDSAARARRACPEAPRPRGHHQIKSSQISKQFKTNQIISNRSKQNKKQNQNRPSLPSPVRGGDADAHFRHLRAQMCVHHGLQRACHLPQRAIRAS